MTPRTPAEPELKEFHGGTLTDYVREYNKLKAELSEANEKLKDVIPKSKVQEAITKLDNDGRLFRYKEVLDMLKELLSEQKGEK